MTRQKRKWHPDFVKYMKFIVKHPNYNGMPSPYKDDSSIRWIVAGASDIGRVREVWWDKKRNEFGIIKKAGWKAKVALKLHPTGEKPCQICGRILKLDYVYPNKICKKNRNTLEECDTKNCDLFNSKQCKDGYRGPGAMSDCPDRFDGFHTYNRCCRSKEDTGRHKDNLSRYGEDRRAYEFWSDGDWKAASWLMQLFRKNGLSPDHIGPLSLGFCHRPKFSPMTRRQNSAKGNRLTLSDIKILIEDEQHGEIVVSSHAKFLWDKLKNLAKTNEDAKKISHLMRLNLHKALTIFSIIAENHHDEFLTNYFLHPEYALRQHAFVDFCPSTGTFSKILTKEVLRMEHIRNAKRYIRKSFEALESYKSKKNRNVLFKINAGAQKLLDETLHALSLKDYKKARKLLDGIFEILAQEAFEKFTLYKKQT